MARLQAAQRLTGTPDVPARSALRSALVPLLGAAACVGAVAVAVVTQLGALFFVPLLACLVLFPVRSREVRSERRPPLDVPHSSLLPGSVAGAGVTGGNVAGTATMLFADADNQTLLLDAMLRRESGQRRGHGAAAPLQPCWMCLRQPAPAWMRASLETVIRSWIADGRPVRVATRMAATGAQMVLDDGASYLVLELENLGGFFP